MIEAEEEALILIQVFRDILKMNKKIYLAIFGIVFLFGILLITPSVNALDWDDSLIAYYKLDGTSGAVIDSTGNGYDGTNNGATRGSGGIISNAFDFDGASDYSISDVNIGINGNNPRSFSFWANGCAAQIDYFLTTGGNSASHDFGLGHLSDCSLYFHGFADDFATSEIMLSTGWQHLVLTYNGTHVKIYINGSLASGGEAAKPSLDTTDAPLYFATKPNLANSYDGTIDEVSVWNRTLSESDISDLYNSGNGLAYEGSPGDFTINVTLASPLNDSVITTTGEDFKVNFSVGGSNSYNYTWKNATYDVWYLNGTLFNETSVVLPTENNTYSELFIDSFSLGNYVWDVRGCYGNATFSNCSYSTNGNFSLEIGANILSINYSNITYETNSEMFVFNVQLLEGSSVSIARLVYNGTNYVITNISESGGVYTFTKVINIPLNFNATENQTNSFYLKFNYEGDSIQELDPSEQVVIPITLTNCSAGNFFLNFSLIDEKTLALLDAGNNITFKANLKYFLNDISVNKTFNNSFSTNKVSLCFSAPTKTIKLYGELEYEDGIHVKRRYYFINDEFTNQTAGINLYNLLATQSTSFVTYLYDASSIAIPDIFIKLKKKYIESDDSKVVEMAKTDEFGMGILHFVSEDDVYEVEYYDGEGNLIYAPADFHAVCLESICSITHTIPYSFSFNPFSSLTSNPNFNYTISSTNNLISLTYNSVDKTTYYDVTLEVDGLSIINDTLRFCSQTLTESLSGTLECNITNSTYNNHQIKVWVDGELEISQYIMKENEDYKEYGKEGIIYALLIVLTLVLIFIWNWTLSLIGAVVGIIISIAFHFIPGTISTAAYLVVLVIYLIITGGKE